MTPRISAVLPSILLGLVACGGTRPEFVQQPNWLVIAPDSLRADQVGKQEITPELTALATTGVRFENAFSQSGWTSPALASLLTGHYPTIMGDPIPGQGPRSVAWLPDSRTLPEILGYYGYHTAAFWGNSIPSGIPAFSKGFQVVSTRTTNRSPSGPDFLDWLATDAKEPFFALLHEVDFSANFSPSGRPDRQSRLEDYREAIFRYDTHIGTVLRALSQAGLADRTIIVVTSNHGLDFMDHDSSVSHGALYDSTIHVPLVIHDPSASKKGLTIRKMVQGIDLSPTILERSGIPLDTTMVGHSLLSLFGMSDVDYVEQDVFSMSSNSIISLRTNRHKLIMCCGNCCGEAGCRCQDQPIFRLFDTRADPGETEDIANEEPVILAELKERLVAWQRQVIQDSSGAQRWEVEEKERQVLKERGYWDLITPTPEKGE